MTATMNVPFKWETGDRNEIPVAATKRLFEGAMAFLDGSGYATPTPGSVFLGHVAAEADNRNGLDGAISVVLRHGRYLGQVPLSGVTLADLSAPVFAVDDNTLSLSGVYEVGKVVRYVGADLAVVEFASPTLSDTGSNPDWNVLGVLLPPHLWRFDLHPDYADRGSVGGLDLAEGGSGNTFLNGLVINGDGGYAYSAADPDVSNLGAVWSILLKLKPNGAGGAYLTCVADDFITGIAILGDGDGTPFVILIGKDESTYTVQDSTTLISNGNSYLIVVTFNAGVIKFYINGIEDVLIDSETYGVVDVSGNGEQGLFVAEFFDAPDFPAGDGTVFEVVAIHKGKEYSQAEVTAIQAGLA